MKQIDFSRGNVGICIAKSAIPLFVAQLINLLYNVVDRIYIARIPDVGTQSMGAIGLCFPLIILILAFTNLYAGGGAPIFSIERGRGDKDKASDYINIVFTLEVMTGLLLTLILFLFSKKLLILFGASDTSLQYALAYFRIYIIGTVFSMLAIGLNPFINAEGFPVIGMVTVAIGAVLNLILDPIFIFSLGLEIRGAAFATLISQVVSAIFVISFLKSKRSEYGIKILSFRRLLALKKEILNVLGLGMTSFIMQVTNSLVQIACNSVLGKTGGDIYISIMALVSSIRQMLEVPLLALVEGSSPVISFNYGAGDYRRVKKAGAYMFLFEIVYALLIWGAIIVFPHFFIAIFSDDASLLEKTQAAVKIYFSTFVFMTFQYTGQTMFKSLNMKRQAIFFSLLRKVVIVIPLTYILPYSFGFGTDGVFMAEPVSNVLGGLASFLTMLFVTRKLLRKKDVEL